MDKRVLLTVAICMAILFVWTKFFMPPPKEQPVPPGATASPVAAPKPEAAKPEAGMPEAGKPEVAKPEAAKPEAGKPEAAKPEVAKTEEKKPEPATPAERPAEVRDRVEFAGMYRAEFTSWGAAPTSWTLLAPQFQEGVPQADGKKKDQPIDLIRTKGANLPFLTTFPQSDFVIPADAAWTKLPPAGDEIAYVWENDKVRVEKHYNFVPKTYQLNLRVVIENKSDKPISEKLQLVMNGKQDPNIKPGGMFSQRLVQTEGQCQVNGKLKHADLQSLLKKPVDEVGQVRWIGIDEKYFLTAVASPPDPNEARRCWVSASTEGVISSDWLSADRKIEAHQKTEYVFAGYLGPKFLHLLDDVTVGGVDAKLGDAVNYGWTEAIARPMLAVLKAVHVVVPNWGIAIIVLTILLKAVTWWPTTKSMKSMREMAKCKPEIDKLKAKYAEDKQKFNMAVMALYKERGISPLGGCLPMLIQMPIYIALYSMLGNSVELYRSSFVGYIHDLTAPDPYYVLPVLTGVLMFAQQRFSPTPPDGQQKAMMYMMPVMFTAFSIFLPSGLTIYILTNTLLTMGQQWWLNRGDGTMARTTPAPKPAKA
jgi:YidC/Oxa1 family membrane protein insertase